MPAAKQKASRPRVTGAVPYKPKMTKAEARSQITEQLGEWVRLADYRSMIPDLTLEQRDTLLDQALLMLEQVYVHLPLKRAMYGIEPIQRLRLLKLHHHGNGNGSMNERQFQSGLIEIFIGLRDLHTNYILPLGYQSRFAFLPFRVEEFYEGQERKFVVSWVSPVSTDKNLKEGVVVTHWNGSPIELAIARNAEREAGSNTDARRARGIEALTLRWFGMDLPPDEDWVTVSYSDGTRTYESRFVWEVIDGKDRQELMAGPGAATAVQAARGWGLDLKTTLLQRVRKLLFDAPAIAAEASMAGKRRAAGVADALGAEESTHPDVFPRFGTVETPSGKFGYVRLATFAPQFLDDDFEAGLKDVIQELIRILSKLPPSGLILDVRGNGGGYIALGERILQLLSPRAITPEPFHFLTTALTLNVARSDEGFGPWVDPITQGIETGASFSQGFPLTALAECNDIGQVYQGPVVLITDALCYSTTDIFAAGFQDHEIGTILGTHETTGAGGANVWEHDLLQSLPLLPENPFAALPEGARMRVAARRSTRLGQRSGVPLEDLGVVRDERYFMTRNDVLNHNEDLIAHAASILAAKPKQTLQISAVDGPPVQRLRIEVSHLDRVDVLAARRPIASYDVRAGTNEVMLPGAVPDVGILRANGYRSGTLVVSARAM
jgi:hypothetical protein